MKKKKINVTLNGLEHFFLLRKEEGVREEKCIHCGKVFVAEKEDHTPHARREEDD